MKRVALYLDNLDEDYQISIYKEIKKETLKRGMTLICIQGRSTEGFIKFDFDGVILLNSVLTNFPIKKISVPIISIGDFIKDIPSIIVNSKKSMNILMKHLVDHHKYNSFLYIGGRKDHYDNIERLHTFENALKSKNVFYDIINGDFHQYSGTISIKKYIKIHPNKKIDVIVCASDYIALGVKKAIEMTKHLSWKNSKITGFDDITNRELEFPGLTSIKQPITELSCIALENLDKLMNNEHVDKITSIESTTVIRTSCGCLDKSNFTIKRKRIEQYSMTISSFGQRLTRVGSFKELLEHLKGFLQFMNIEDYYMLLKDLNSSYRLIYQKKDSKEEDFLNSQKKISIEDILLNDNTATSYIIYHLISGDKEVGVIIYKCDDSILSQMCTSSAYIANAVNQLRTLEMEKKHSTFLEAEVTRRTADLIESNNALELEIKRRIEVEAEVLKISEMERERFSLDLHDDICQRLAGISMMTKSLPKTTDLEKICELLDDTLLRTRKYAHNSFPMELHSLGLKRSIMELVSSIKDQSRIEFFMEWEDYDFTSEEQINIFRIFQEAIQNSLKHANATSVKIIGELTQNSFKITISDNGNGLSYNKEQPQFEQLKRLRPEGLGLKSMEYRAHQIKAEYNYTSTPSTGTCIEIIIPKNKN